ncbi:hypothetical protein FBR07_02050 [Candidatus Uhrbacteria bacterium UHB]|nr:hypothetical protein [Candidatus Uhrbacteria bacterium UHB]RIL00664.1 MAG: hypothetical protein DCC77_03905 [Candidatus Uhrbacteria bacterium]
MTETEEEEVKRGNHIPGAPESETQASHGHRVTGAHDAVVPSGIYNTPEKPPMDEVLKRRALRKEEKRARKIAAKERIGSKNGLYPSPATWPSSSAEARSEVINPLRVRSWFCPNVSCDYHDHLTPLTHQMLRGKAPPYVCPVCPDTVKLLPAQDNGLPPWYCADTQRRSQDKLRQLYERPRVSKNASNKGGAS